jgi:hypothetical protein
VCCVSYVVSVSVLTQDKINTRVNRRDNQEWTTQRHWQLRIHKTQDKINTRVNRRDNQEWTTQRHWHIRRSHCLCVVYSWLSLLFTLVFILSWVLCVRCCHSLCVVHSWLSLHNQEWTTQRHWQHRIHKTQDKINTRVNKRDNQEWTTQRHWHLRIHKTQDKINLLFTVVFILSCVLCIRCCHCLCVIHSLLSLLFFIVPSVYSSVYFVHRDTVNIVYTTHKGQNKH